jgi:predicted nuclease with TOPRIM domain
MESTMNGTDPMHNPSGDPAALQERLKQLEAESLQQRQRIEQLEAEKVRLYWEISRLRFNEKDWENFDPSQYTGSKEEILAIIDSVKE